MTKFNQEIYDLVGVGVGPFNLGLACLTQPVEEMKAVFFDKKDGFDWHQGIMPEWSTLQIPFIADLVSFADPSSQFSFLKYLKDTRNIYQFYIRESYYVLRSEYNDYCKWVVAQLDNIHFRSRVDDINYDEEDGLYVVSGFLNNRERFSVMARNIILGTGTSPKVPDFCRDLMGDVHLSADYLKHKESYADKKIITIVGSGQSGAEIYYDLLSDIDRHQYQLNWITQSPHFFSMDLGKLTLEYTSPDYTNHFFSLSEDKRDQIIASQDVMYKGIERGLVNNIYDLLYIKSRYPGFSTRIMPNSRLDAINKNHAGLDLTLRHLDTDRNFRLATDVLILALGYEYKLPRFVDKINRLLNWDDNGRLKLNFNYSVNDKQNIFVQNVGLYSHGISVPDLGMGCYRNSIIINRIMDREVYPVEKNIAFQNFSPEI